MVFGENRVAELYTCHGRKKNYKTVVFKCDNFFFLFVFFQNLWMNNNVNWECAKTTKKL